MKKVLITGVFDLLHQEHFNFLHKARQFVDELNKSAKQDKYQLFLGLESDQRVKALKGKERPLNSALHRQKVLQDLNLFDQVFILPKNFNTPEQREQFIKQLRPSYLLVSSSTPYIKQKEKLLAKYGGKVKIIHQHNPNFSSTKLITQLKKGEK